jgi:hypothetical protein
MIHRVSSSTEFKHSIPPWEQVCQACGRSAIGKRLPDAFYVHCCALSSLDPLLQDLVILARSFLPVDLADVIAAPSPDLRVQLLIKFITHNKIFRFQKLKMYGNLPWEYSMGF